MPYSRVSFWMIFSDFAKYSVTQSIAQTLRQLSLCTQVSDSAESASVGCVVCIGLWSVSGVVEVGSWWCIVDDWQHDNDIEVSVILQWTHSNIRRTWWSAHKRCSSWQPKQVEETHWHWSVMMLLCHWSVMMLSSYWSVTNDPVLSLVCNDLSCYWSVMMLSCYWSVMMLSCRWPVMICPVTGL